jgi:hypothetical protein
MAIINSKTGKVIRDYSVEELQHVANLAEVAAVG